MALYKLNCVERYRMNTYISFKHYFPDIKEENMNQNNLQ